ncbi:FtsK/SpoIIIE family DNA translocase [Virgibacillus halodenitrificans]|uniref:DNA translocase FtsK n=1 Tax=Virgibacillus halodenitrificans TaxID=1482 RepID=A0ABR7VU07_VIRHA|nr:DNA translocase FtsK [Virgibacillus halodenitrificans]MBD1224222.1 DNA translocase FtsK [Virgibacillus halodenitrificans]MYL47750.1 cell division protein FtsK [Virgibacillus halodenitrificans]MYL57298.1 cell division protein FtsK [Virgibacillus halodenitrificans]WHX27218.1 DNA translocase FtsK [Virgibacillus halodenitrificans]
MAKKRRKKKSNKIKKQLKLELLGLLFIFLAIFGSGASAISDGAIPGGLEYFFRFFLGIWYFVASIFLMITGLLLVIKRKYPDFFNKKLIGFYILFIGILLMTHIQTFDRLLVNENVSILAMTWEHFIAFINGEGNAAALGGGMIGAILFMFSYYLFSLVGAKIVASFSIIIGIIYMTEFSLGDFSSKLLKKFSSKLSTIRNGWKERKIANRETKKTKTENEKMGMESTYDEKEEPVIQDFTDTAYSYQEIEKEMPEKQEIEQVSVNKTEDLAKEDPIEHLPMTEVENYEYELPSPKLLAEPSHNSQQNEKSQIQATVKKLEKTFQSFGVKARVTKVNVGPAVTKYEIYPEAGVKVSKIVSLHDDLALALAAKDIRIEAPIPGKSAVGIEVPNQEIAMVSLREVLDNSMNNLKSKLLFALGRDISGEAIVAELNKMPHLLIAGATGSGKSVCVNGIITTILMRTKPHEVKMMMIDPKKVELNVYNGIPHLLAPVVTDPKKASRALKKVVSEMERRYELFSDTGTRNIEGYNEYIRKYNQTTDEEQPNLPYIVVLVDELADLMMVASNDVEDAITRLAQMARAAGIHLIIATQRPSVDVITGVIKANIPSRIAFSVSSQTDSRTILDSGGAEKLLGRGDMLFMPVGTSKPVRVQGAFLSDEEVERIVDHCIDQQKASYQEEMIPEETSEVKEEVDDELYEEAVQLVTEMQSASVSMLQRRFRVGYTRAARLIDAMEDRGIVGPYEGSKPRTVLVTQATEEQTS